MLFSRVSMFPEERSMETLRFEEDKTNCFPMKQSSSVLLSTYETLERIHTDPCSSSQKVKKPYYLLYFFNTILENPSLLTCE